MERISAGHPDAGRTSQTRRGDAGGGSSDQIREVPRFARDDMQRYVRLPDLIIVDGGRANSRGCVNYRDLPA